MEFVVVILLALSTAVALAGWRVRGLGQVAMTVALFAGLGTTAALLGFGHATVPATGFAMVFDVGALGLLAVAGGGVATTSVFRLIDGSDESAEGSMRQAGDVLRGGAWIGGLERTAVFICVVSGWPTGLAIILALKGLGRYDELRSKTPGAAERFIIGTFTSVLWAIACAAVALLLLG